MVSGHGIIKLTLYFTSFKDYYIYVNTNLYTEISSDEKVSINNIFRVKKYYVKLDTSVLTILNIKMI